MTGDNNLDRLGRRPLTEAEQKGSDRGRREFAEEDAERLKSLMDEGGDGRRTKDDQLDSSDSEQQGRDQQRDLQRGPASDKRALQSGQASSKKLADAKPVTLDTKTSARAQGERDRLDSKDERDDLDDVPGDVAHADETTAFDRSSDDLAPPPELTDSRPPEDGRPMDGDPNQRPDAQPQRGPAEAMLAAEQQEQMRGGAPMSGEQGTDRSTGRVRDLGAAERGRRRGAGMEDAEAPVAEGGAAVGSSVVQQFAAVDEASASDVVGSQTELPALFEQLVERMGILRATPGEAGNPDQMSLTLNDDTLGGSTVNIERSDDGISVSFDAATDGIASFITDNAEGLASRLADLLGTQITINVVPPEAAPRPQPVMAQPKQDAQPGNPRVENVAGARVAAASPSGVRTVTANPVSGVSADSETDMNG